jgi:hypothetical protein
MKTSRLNARRLRALVVLLLLLTVCAPFAREANYRLYTDPDPSCGGGIAGEIVNPNMPIVTIVAVPPDEPRLVYKGSVGTGGRSFSFDGLPMRKYDLVVIYDKHFYEGLNLHREENTLTGTDRQQINATVQKAEPYFTKRVVHRLEGTTGRTSLARCICTFVRDTRSTNSPKGDVSYRRSTKIILLKQVGPGWQVVRTRDLFPTWARKENMFPTHHYSTKLSRIRVTSRVKDLGELDLSK